MLQIQAFNPEVDKHMSISASKVLTDNDSGGGVVIPTESSIDVDIKFIDMATAVPDTLDLSSITMSKNTETGMWLIDTTVSPFDFSHIFWKINHKYTGLITEVAGGTVGMLDIMLGEFVLTDNITHQTLLELSNRVVINKDDTVEARMEWFDGTGTKFYAALYQGNTGTQYATNQGNITHRGEIQKGSPS